MPCASRLVNAEGVCKFQPRATPWETKDPSQWNSERVREIIERFATGLSPQPLQGWYNSTSNLPRVAR